MPLIGVRPHAFSWLPLVRVGHVTPMPPLCSDLCRLCRYFAGNFRVSAGTSGGSAGVAGSRQGAASAGSSRSLSRIPPRLAEHGRVSPLLPSTEPTDNPFGIVVDTSLVGAASDNLHSPVTIGGRTSPKIERVAPRSAGDAERLLPSLVEASASSAGSVDIGSGSIHGPVRDSRQLSPSNTRSTSSWPTGDSSHFLLPTTGVQYVYFVL